MLSLIHIDHSQSLKGLLLVQNPVCPCPWYSATDIVKKTQLGLRKKAAVPVEKEDLLRILDTFKAFLGDYNAPLLEDFNKCLPPWDIGIDEPNWRSWLDEYLLIAEQDGVVLYKKEYECNKRIHIICFLLLVFASLDLGTVELVCEDHAMEWCVALSSCASEWYEKKRKM